MSAAIAWLSVRYDLLINDWMKLSILLLAVGGLACGFRAALLWYQASKINVVPFWVEDGCMEPVDPLQSATSWIIAMMQTTTAAGDLNKSAAWWTGIAVALGGLSSVLSGIPSPSH